MFARTRASKVIAAALEHQGDTPVGLEQDAQRLATHYYGYKGAYETLSAEVGELRPYKAACERLSAEVAELRSYRLSYKKMAARFEQLKADRDSLKDAHDALKDSHEALAARFGRIETERDGHKGAYEALNAEVGELRGYRKAYEELNAEVNELRDYRSAYETLSAEVGGLRAERDGYRDSYDKVAAELGKLRVDAEPQPRTDEEARRMAGKPSVFVVCQPKAGTKYIGATLARTLGYDYGRNVVSHTFPKNLIWQGMAHDFLRGGMVSVSHLQPDDFNVKALKDIGITRGVIQFRDPRAALYSEFHYFVDHGLYKIYDPVGGEAFLDLGKDQQIDHHIERFFKPLIHWIDAWIDVLDDDRDLDFLVTTYDELVADERRLFSKILAFHGLDAELKPAAKDRNTHFRSGNDAEWRIALSQEQIGRLNAMIPDRLWQRFGWEP